MHFSFFSLLVCYARISRFVSSAVCLSVTQESRALFLLQFVYQLRKNLVHCFFCSLLICYAKISHTVSSLICWSATQESRALLLVLIACLSRENLAQNLFPGFVGLLCKNLAHCLSLSLLFCYARISRTVSSVVCLSVTQESWARIVFGLLVCQARVSCTFPSSVCLSVTQESRALFLLQFACLLHKNLARYFFCSLFISYARISCTVSSVVCMSVTQESRARIVSGLLVCYARVSCTFPSSVGLSVMQKSRALFLLQFACLLRENLARYFFCSLFVCHARISRTIYSLGLLVCCARISRTASFLVCFSVTRESRALFLLQFSCLLRKNLAQCFFCSSLVSYARI